MAEVEVEERDGTLKNCRIGICRFLLPANEMHNHVVTQHNDKFINLETSPEEASFKIWSGDMTMKYKTSAYYSFVLFAESFGLCFVNVEIDNKGAFALICETTYCVAAEHGYNYAVEVTIPGFSPTECKIDTNYPFVNSESIHASSFSCHKDEFEFYYGKRARDKRERFPIKVTLMIQEVEDIVVDL